MKKWYLSKTLWGVIISMAGLISKHSIPDISSEIVEIIGLVLAAYGRLVADTKIG